MFEKIKLNKTQTFIPGNEYLTLPVTLLQQRLAEAPE